MQRRWRRCGSASLWSFRPASRASPTVAGLGADSKPFLWLAAAGKSTLPVHLAFRAENRAQVDAFYRAAIAAGGKDNGAPVVRAIYHPDHYGAFAVDADGTNSEACCHTPE